MPHELSARLYLFLHLEAYLLHCTISTINFTHTASNFCSSLQVVRCSQMCRGGDSQVDLLKIGTSGLSTSDVRAQSLRIGESTLEGARSSRGSNLVGECNASRGLLRALREGRQTVATPEVVAQDHDVHPQGFAQDRSALHSVESRKATW